MSICMGNYIMKWAVVHSIHCAQLFPFSAVHLYASAIDNIIALPPDSLSVLSPSLSLSVRVLQLGPCSILARLAKDSSLLSLWLPGRSALGPKALSCATGWALLHMTCPFAR